MPTLACSGCVGRLPRLRGSCEVTSARHEALGCRGLRFVAYRQARDLVGSRYCPKCGFACELNAYQARDELAEERAQLHLRQVLAETGVRPVAEGNVGVGPAVDLEGEWIREHLLVPVGGGEEQKCGVACLDGLAAQR